jgi:hypothetical protein
MKNNNLISNKILAFIAIIITINFLSCGDLEENVGEARLDPASLTSLEALQATIVGVYEKVNAASRWAGFWTNEYGADDLTTHSGKNKIGWRDFDKRSFSATSERIDVAWIEPYKVIKAVNNIIENRNNYSDNDQQKIDYIIGEAYFLRGLYYFHLTNNFGKVPLNLTTEIDSELGLSEIIDIYKQIEADFLAAENLLPSKYPGVSAAIRPNSGSARAYLGKLYMHWAGWPLKDNTKYAIAASSAKQVIDNASSHGFELVPDMNTLWSQLDENRLNSEIVFGVSHCQTCANRYSNRHSGRLGYATDVGGWNEIFAEIAYLNDFPEGPRKDATFVLEGKLKKNDSDGIHKKGQVVPWTVFDDEAHPSFKKVTGHLSEIKTGNSNTSITTYFMRYADLLLMYAEAEGRSGGSSADAWEALNKVRRRANALPVNEPNPDVDLTSGDLAEIAYTERKWELGGEFIRWGDLIRMERVAEALANRSPDELVGPITGSTSPDNYFAKIPQSEIDKAPHLGN